MEKVLIISYFFPPCNLTASQRIYSWARFLNEYGYYPTVVTRRWDIKINAQNDMSLQTPSEIVYEKYPEYEVYYLPYKPGLKDRIYSKYGESKYVILRKILSLTELVLQNVCLSSIPYSNIYHFSKKLVKENKDIKKLIVSGNPYIQFKFAYKLNKKYGISWIADYRDAWTNSKINSIGRNAIFDLLNKYDRFFEKKWVRTASSITSVSDKLVNQISSLVKTQGDSIFNGFVDDDFKNYRNEEPYKKFTVTYVGTLFPGQKLELFLEVYKRFIDSNVVAETKLLLPGLAFKREQEEMVEKVMKGYEKYYECSERVDREEVLRTEVRSHLLLYVAWEGFSGIVPSKIYEYIASGSYILVAPSDNDAVDDIVNRSGCGVSLSSPDDIFNLLNDLYSKYLNGIKLTNDLKTDNVKQFSRKLQVEKLKNILNNI